MYDKTYFEGKGSNIRLIGYKFTVGKRETFEGMVTNLKSCGKVHGRLLDIGCGFGYFLAVCDTHGYETFGVDISEYALNEAKRVTKANLRVADAENLPFASSSFDIVTVLDVLEHVQTPALVVGECYRVLKPAGVLLLLTPNTGNVMTSLLLRDKTHVQHFTSRSLMSLLKGFIPISIKEEPPFLTFIKNSHLRHLLRNLSRIFKVNINLIFIGLKDEKAINS